MHKCVSAHWYGNEFVKPGSVFSDSDPVVTRAPANFEPLHETVEQPDTKPSTPRKSPR